MADNEIAVMEHEKRASRAKGAGKTTARWSSS
jgi:hypothetical protein